jgi:hypothetical protein
VTQKSGARILLVLGFLAAFVGYDAWIVSHAIFDPGATRAAAHALLEAPAVRQGLADQITTELYRQLPNAEQDPRARAAVAAALHDPRVANAFADTIAQIHAAVLSGAPTRTGEQTFTIDGHALSDALHDALAPHDPQLAAQVRTVPPLAVHIKANDMPRLHDPRSTADVVTVLAVMAAFLLITASLILQHDRRTIGRVGRRTAFLAFTPLIVFFALPGVLGHASGDAAQIASALLRVYGDRVLPSAIALIVIGLTIAISALVWPRHPLRDAHDAARRPPPYTGPEPPRPRVAPDQPSITEKMYL